MRVAIGLGTNLGDRLELLREAVRRVGLFAHVVARSRVYETEPVGGPPQGAFLNAAILVECTQTPLGLLDELHRIEQELGRTRDVRWGPRTIDLDILWIDGVASDAERLTVPHPRLAERAFAVLPLLDVASDARDPRTGAPYAVISGAGVRQTDLSLLAREG